MRLTQLLEQLKEMWGGIRRTALDRDQVCALEVMRHCAAELGRIENKGQLCGDLVLVEFLAYPRRIFLTRDEMSPTELGQSDRDQMVRLVKIKATFANSAGECEITSTCRVVEHGKSRRVADFCYLTIGRTNFMFEHDPSGGAVGFRTLKYRKFGMRVGDPAEPATDLDQAQNHEPV